MCHQVVIPEIPRTKHEGGGGVHVSGNEQESSFQQRPLNTQRDVQLNMIRLWEIAYGIDMRTRIDHAQVVNITEHPCDKKPIPKHKVGTSCLRVRAFVLLIFSRFNIKVVCGSWVLTSQVSGECPLRLWETYMSPNYDRLGYRFIFLNRVQTHKPSRCRFLPPCDKRLLG